MHELTSPKKGRPKKTQTTVTDTKTQSNACSKDKERFQKNSTLNEENESSSKRSKVSTFFFSLLICFYFNCPSGLLLTTPLSCYLQSQYKKG